MAPRPARDWPQTPRGQRTRSLKLNLTREASGASTPITAFSLLSLHSFFFFILSVFGHIKLHSYFRGFLLCFKRLLYLAFTIRNCCFHFRNLATNTTRVKPPFTSAKMKTTFFLALLSTAVSFVTAGIVITPVFADQIVQKQAGDCFFGVVTPQGCA